MASASDRFETFIHADAAWPPYGPLARNIRPVFVIRPLGETAFPSSFTRPGSRSQSLATHLRLARPPLPDDRRGKRSSDAFSDLDRKAARVYDLFPVQKSAGSKVQCWKNDLLNSELRSDNLTALDTCRKESPLHGQISFTEVLEHLYCERSCPKRRTQKIIQN